MKKSIISALILSLPLLANAASGAIRNGPTNISLTIVSTNRSPQSGCSHWNRSRNGGTGAGSATSKPFAGRDGAAQLRVYNPGHVTQHCLCRTAAVRASLCKAGGERHRH